MRRVTVVVVATLALIGLGAACSTGTGGAATCDSPTKTTEVDMQNIAFTVPCVSATANDTLSLVNKDSTEHTYRERVAVRHRARNVLRDLPVPSADETDAADHLAFRTRAAPALADRVAIP
jgi:hypothetical protein